MPRLNVVDPASATGAVKEIFDGPLKGKHVNIFKGFANSPAAFQGFLGFKGGLDSGELSPAEGELVALIVGEANTCDYCVAAHTTIGKSVGLTEDQAVAARKGDAIGDARLDAIATFTRALVEKRGFVEDSDIDAFRSAGFGDSEIVEIIGLLALNTFTNYFNHVNETVIDFPAVPALA